MAYLSRLGLTNYRNFRQVEIELPLGVSVFAGGNAQGKTALLEAAYTLAIGRSFRADSEREVVNFDAANRGDAAYVSGLACRDGREISAVVGYLPAGDGRGRLAAATDCDSTGQSMPPVRKQIRVNRQPGTAASLLGHIGVTLFFADDVDLVLGPTVGAAPLPGHPDQSGRQFTISRRCNATRRPCETAMACCAGSGKAGWSRRRCCIGTTSWCRPVRRW